MVEEKEMEDFSVKIISRSRELPDNISNSYFFHGSELFCILEKIPAHSPYMAIAQAADGTIVGQMLATTRRRASILPFPYLFTQARIYGEGCYDEKLTEEQKNHVFGLLLSSITRVLKRKFLCLYIEFSDISTKMFGYQQFRRNDYFPVGWQEVCETLDDDTDPSEQLSEKLHNQIMRAKSHGVITREAQNAEEIHTFYMLLKRFNRLKFWRFIPSEELFQELVKSENAKVFLTIYRDKIIGGSACSYEQGNAFLWYFASKRKTYHALHPNAHTIWHTIQYAYNHNYAHLYFLDGGLPFYHYPQREFLINFGGTPITKYRWWRFSIPVLNRFLCWMFGD